MALERTLTIVKPDAVAAGHIGEIVAALEQADEGSRCRVETVDDVFAVFDPPVADERSHLLHERRRPIVVVADDEAFDHRALNEQRPEIRTVRELRRVVLRNETT